VSTPTRRVALAIDALRHGWPIVFEGAFALLPAETGFGEGEKAVHLLISAARAATLKLANQREAAEPEAPVMIRGAEPFDLVLARAVADPALDLTWPMKGPFVAEPIAYREAAVAAMELARLAGVLPAFLVDPDPAGEAQEVAAADLVEWKDAASLKIAARAKLPITACEAAEIIAFRSVNDLREHVALVIGRQTGDTVPLVRLHSECLTGDILGSLKCDCGPQLDAALAAMAAEASQALGWGVLPYQLQDQGFDTVDANNRLGLPSEARDFPVAARMLALLGVQSIRMLTNNPDKVSALEKEGVQVIERVPHQLPANPHNQRYLASKRDRAGHLLKL
jgi:GTP cyclohydrolase II